MKNTTVILLLVFLFLSGQTSVFAVAQRQVIKEDKKNFLYMIKEMINNISQEAAKIIGGKITAINGSTLNIEKEGKNYIVHTDEKTQPRRHYWGESSLQEFSVGNKVNVVGRFIDKEKTTIMAHMIRDLSIMKRHGLFLAEVTKKNNDNFAMKPVNRPDQTVYFRSSTKFKDRLGRNISYASIQVGHKVKVRGIWDKSSNKVTEVVEVRDLSFPPQPTKSP